MEFQDSRFGVEGQDSLDNVGEPDTIAEKDLPATISLKHLEDSGKFIYETSRVILNPDMCVCVRCIH